MTSGTCWSGRNEKRHAEIVGLRVTTAIVRFEHAKVSRERTSRSTEGYPHQLGKVSASPEVLGNVSVTSQFQGFQGTFLLSPFLVSPTRLQSPLLRSIRIHGQETWARHAPRVVAPRVRNLGRCPPGVRKVFSFASQR